jgi:hypothetical protein
MASLAILITEHIIEVIIVRSHAYLSVIQVRLLISCLMSYHLALVKQRPSS